MDVVSDADAHGSPPHNGDKIQSVEQAGVYTSGRFLSMMRPASTWFNSFFDLPRPIFTFFSGPSCDEQKNMVKNSFIYITRIKSFQGFMQRDCVAPKRKTAALSQKMILTDNLISTRAATASNGEFKCKIDDDIQAERQKRKS
jgi:hypothetical protein